MRVFPSRVATLWIVSTISAMAVSPMTFAQTNLPATPAQQAAPNQAPAPPKEVALTDKQIQGVLDAQKEFDAIAEKMPKTEAAQSDPQYVTQFEAIAKAHGFASYADYNDVVFTMSIVLNGIDAKTKSYVGPEAVLKQQLAAVRANSKIPAADKKLIVDEINAALKSPPPPVQNQSNIDLVTKNYDKLAAAMSESN